MIRFTLAQLQEKARMRPAGYYEEVLSFGEVRGGIVELDDAAHAALARKYRGTAADPLPPEPGATELAANFAAALGRWAGAGFPVVAEAVYRARAEACAGCEFWDGAARLGLGKCRHAMCGCTKMKRWLATERCPIDKWPVGNERAPHPNRPAPGSPPAEVPAAHPA